MLTGLFIGRFQPFHLAHARLISKALTHCTHLKVVIGSAQASNTWYNPFTAQERKDMIGHCFPEQLANGTIRVYTLNDIEDPATWPEYILANTGELDVLFSGNIDGVVKLFRNSIPNMDVIMFGDKGKSKSGTEIRKMMVSGSEEWPEFVPTSTANVILDVKGIERLKKIYYNI